MHDHTYLDMGRETLNLKCCEWELGELTVTGGFPALPTAAAPKAGGSAKGVAGTYTASIQEFNLEKRAQPLGDLNFQRTF